MAREIIAVRESTETGDVVRLVQDRHDDPERTDRWFVECQLRFPTQASARDCFALIAKLVKLELP